FADLASRIDKTPAELERLSKLYQESSQHKGSGPTNVVPRFILPPRPRPEMRSRRKGLPTYEKMNKGVAQRKCNGTHVVIWIFQDNVVLWDRRGTALTLYKLTPGMKKCLTSLARDADKELVVCGELLHTKAKSKITQAQAATDTIVLFDVIYY